MTVGHETHRKEPSDEDKTLRKISILDSNTNIFVFILGLYYGELNIIQGKENLDQTWYGFKQISHWRVWNQQTSLFFVFFFFFFCFVFCCDKFFFQ